MTLAELRAALVAPFTLSKSRPEIADGLERLLEEWMAAPIDGEVWVDGSFVTSKIDPGDVDIILRVTSDFRDNANPAQVAALDLIATDLKASHRCDAYLKQRSTTDFARDCLGGFAVGVVVDGDVSATRRKRPRNRRANAAAPAGDECSASFEIRRFRAAGVASCTGSGGRANEEAITGQTASGYRLDSWRGSVVETPSRAARSSALRATKSGDVTIAGRRGRSNGTSTFAAMRPGRGIIT
jgi:hypothetical protein